VVSFLPRTIGEVVAGLVVSATCDEEAADDADESWLAVPDDRASFESFNPCELFTLLEEVCDTVDEPDVLGTALGPTIELVAVVEVSVRSIAPPLVILMLDVIEVDVEEDELDVSAAGLVVTFEG
jgi:hypothetical protein